MKRILTLVFSVFALLLLLTPTVQAAETYTLDASHTYVLWHINHFGFSNPSGKWMATGTLVLDEAKPQDSKLNVTINVAAIDTGIPKLDEHLKGAQFFDVKQFPTATFISNKIDVTGKNTAKVHGVLTLHGVSKPLTLNVTLNKIGENPITNKKTAGFTAHAQLLRSDFGINTLLPGLSDKVKLNIEAEAYKSN
jgi:polyisoprenoid-binding protein YceI